MKNRKFRNTGLQAMYDHFRSGKDEYANSAAGCAYRSGVKGHRDPGVPTSLAHAAWAAGADVRHDMLEMGDQLVRDTEFATME